MVELNQEQYEQVVFLTKCVYHDLPWPSSYGLVHEVELFSGLRFNVFDFPDHMLIVICGTNSTRDWIANFKVFFRITPRQHRQALKHVREIYNKLPAGKPLIIAGHSLGAGIAEYCASFFHDDVLMIGFNGCGVAHLCKNHCEYNMVHVITDRDILNCLTSLLPGKRWMKHLGEKNIIKDKTTWNPVKSHGNFDKFMEFDWSERE